MAAVDFLLLAIPFISYWLCITKYGYDFVVLSAFGAAAFSFSAFASWLYSRQLAARYLRERSLRNKARLRDMGVVGSSVDAHRKGKDELEVSSPPRTVARVAPVLPAFMSLVFILGVIGNLLTAAVLIIIEVRRG